MNEYSITIQVTPMQGGFNTIIKVSNPNVQFTEVGGILKQTAVGFYNASTELVKNSPELLKKMEQNDFTWDQFVEVTSK